tara:strand:- start:1903 stop:2703 length:801 start_codon:yes stop_codon:yes gene_type:complete
MIGFVIPCSFNNRINILKLCKFFSNKEHLKICLVLDKKLISFLSNEKVKFKNILLKNTESNNVSYKRNIGIKSLLKEKNIEYISFLDSDCFINERNLKLIQNYLLNYPNKDIYFINIITKSKKRIGNKLKNYYFNLNFLNIYRAGTPSIIIKSNFINNLFDTNFGIGTDNFSAEDTKFLIDNFSYNVRVIDDAKIFHPNDKMNYDKIKNYSYGQKILIKTIKFPHNFIFFTMIIYRPFLGLIYSIFKFDTNLIKIYLVRLKQLIYV